MTRTNPGFTTRLPDSDSPSAVVTMVSIGHFLSHVYQLAFPPLFPLLASDLGLTNTELGLLVSVIYLLMLLFQTPLGSVVDTIGAKPIFVCGLVVTGGGTVLAGFASIVKGVIPVYMLLLLAAAAIGIGQATFHPTDYPLIDAVSDDTNQGKYFGVHMFTGYLGFAAAPIVVGGLGFAYSWEFALITVGLVGILYAVVSQLFLSTVYLDQINDRNEASEPTEETAGLFSGLGVLLQPRILIALLFFTTVSIASIGIGSFTVVFVTDGFQFSEAFGNTVLSTFMVLAAAGILIGGILADRFSIPTLITVMLFLATAFVSATIVGPIVTSTLLIVLFAGTGLCYGMTIPARDRLISLISPPDALGKSFGFVTSGISIGGIVSPLLIGFLIDTFDVFVGFSAVAISFFLSGLIIVTMWLTEP